MKPWLSGDCRGRKKKETHITLEKRKQHIWESRSDHCKFNQNHSLISHKPCQKHACSHSSCSRSSRHLPRGCACAPGGFVPVVDIFPICCWVAILNSFRFLWNSFFWFILSTTAFMLVPLTSDILAHRSHSTPGSHHEIMATPYVDIKFPNVRR